MDPLAVGFTAVVIAAGVAVLSFAVRSMNAVEEAWSTAAEQLRFVHSRSEGRELRGLRGRYPVVVDTFTRGLGKHEGTYSRITLDAQGRIPLDLELKPESSWDGIKKVFTGEDLQVGSSTFDHAVLVAGSEAAALGALGTRARDGIRRLLFQLRGEVRNGTLYLERPGVFKDARFIVSAVEAMAEIAEALEVPSIPRALMANAKGELLAGVRRRNLEALLSRYPTSEEADLAVSNALSDPEPDIRLLAAKHGRSELRRQALSALIRDLTAAEPLRVEALEHLLRVYGGASNPEALAAALWSSSTALAAVALRAVGEGKHLEHLNLVRALAEGPDGGLAAEAAGALAQLGDAQAEPLLVKLLERADLRAQRAAARALGQLGSVNAVEPLLPLTASLLAGSELRTAARDAIREIQSRLGDAEGGRLSLAPVDGAAGGLSVAGGESGALSVPRDRSKD